MRPVRLLAVFLLVLSTAAWAGCGATGGDGGKIEGINWVLKSYDSKGTARDVPRGLSIDALFEGAKVSGFSGVNTYQGEYELSGSSLTIGKVASTMMAGPQDLMDIERGYLAGLEQTSSYTADAGTLALLDRNGQKLLVYARGETATLTGGTWNVISYYNGRDGIVSVINGTTLTAVFSDDGVLTGSTGVNDYRATYKTEGQKISVEPPAVTTGNSSPDPAAMQQQADYLAALPLAVSYGMKGDILEMRRPDNGYAVTFERAR